MLNSRKSSISINLDLVALLFGSNLSPKPQPASPCRFAICAQTLWFDQCDKHPPLRLWGAVLGGNGLSRDAAATWANRQTTNISRITHAYTIKCLGHIAVYVSIFVLFLRVRSRFKHYALGHRQRCKMEKKCAKLLFTTLMIFEIYESKGDSKIHLLENSCNYFYYKC